LGSIQQADGSVPEDLVAACFMDKKQILPVPPAAISIPQEHALPPLGVPEVKKLCATTFEVGAPASSWQATEPAAGDLIHVLRQQPALGAACCVLVGLEKLTGERVCGRIHGRTFQRHFAEAGDSFLFRVDGSKVALPRTSLSILPALTATCPSRLLDTVSAT